MLGGCAVRCARTLVVGTQRETPPPALRHVEALRVPDVRLQPLPARNMSRAFVSRASKTCPSVAEIGWRWDETRDVPA